MCFDKKLSKNDRGFTLLELIVTVVILAMVAAPFLSSFVSAAKTNEKSKRIDEATELGKYIIEQYKASSIDHMVNTYNLTTTNESIDSTLSSGYSKVGKNYSVNNFQMENIITGGTDNYKGYTVNISLKPVMTNANRDDAIPSIDGIDREKCVVLVDNLTRYDVLSGSNQSYKRKIEITVRYDTTDANFYVDADIATLNSASVKVSGDKTTWKYDKGIPSVYMLYQPLSTLDEITVDNQVVDSDYDHFNANNANVLLDDTLTISPDKDKVNVYIVNQKNSFDTYAVNYDGARVFIKEKDASGAVVSKSLLTLFSLITSKEDSKIFDRTVVYSNIWETSTSINTDISQRSDKKDTVNGTVKLVKYDTIYEIKVDVYYKGKFISTFESSKTISN